MSKEEITKIVNFLVKRLDPQKVRLAGRGLKEKQEKDLIPMLTNVCG